MSSSTGNGGAGMTSSMGALTYSGPAEDGSAKATKAPAKKAGPAQSTGTFPGTPKNAQCPCGSGKKYKMCHGKNEVA
jgi:preprotein translocase subunit SecA